MNQYAGIIKSGNAYTSGAFSVAAGGGTTPGVLDAQTLGLSNGWSVYRRLLTSYSGPLIRVRADRAGQPEMDIPFIPGTGRLDVDALLAFAGADSCYNTTVYDQAGGANMVQADPGLQPRMVNTGSLEVNNLSVPAQMMSGTTLRAATSIAWPFTMYSNGVGVMDGNFRILWGLEGIGRHAGKLNTSKYYANGGIVSNLDVTGNNQMFTYRFAVGTNNDVLRVDGVNSGVVDGVGSPGSGYPLRWGNTGDLGAPWSGKSTELVLYQGASQAAFADVEAALALPIPPFSPSEISDLQLWMDAKQPMYASNGGAQATAAGNQIGYVPDQSGLGRALTSGANKATYDPVGLNGKPAANFNANAYLTSLSFLDASFATACTVFAVYSHPGGAVGQYFFGVPSNTMFGLRSGASKTVSAGGTGLTPTVTPPGYVGEGTPAIFGWSYDGAEVRQTVDRFFTQVGSAVSTGSSASTSKRAATGNLALSGTLTIGGLSNNGSWPGGVSEFLVFKRALSTDEWKQMLVYLANKWGMYETDFVMCVGNSLTSGQGSTSGDAQPVTTTGNNYPSYLQNSLGSSAVVRTDAFPGRTLDQIISGIPEYSRLIVTPSLTGKNRTAIVWEGTNSLGALVSPADCWTKTATICTMLRSYGFDQILIGTVLPSGTNPTTETNRQSYNTLVRSNFAAVADGVADFGADVTIGVAGAQNNTTYYNVDKLHLKDVGYVIVASIAKTAIDAL